MKQGRKARCVARVFDHAIPEGDRILERVDTALERLIRKAAAFERIKNRIAIIPPPGIEPLQTKGVVERGAGILVCSKRAEISPAGAGAPQKFLGVCDRSISVVVVNGNRGSKR